MLRDLLLVRPAAFVHACTARGAPWWIGLFLVASGIVYGACLTYFQRAMLTEIQGVPIADMPAGVHFAINVLAGLITVFLIHIGITFFAWIAARGMGGPGILVAIYRVCAYLLPLGWLMLPQITLSNVAATAPEARPPTPLLWMVLAGLGLAWFLAGLYQAFLVTQERNAKMTALGVGLFTLLLSSLLLLIV